MKIIEMPGRQKGKRALSTLLVCLLTFSLFPLIPAPQAGAEPLDRIERDVYIGWDISEGMAGQPHLEARAAIQNLIKALFKDDRYDTWVGLGIITSFAAWMGPCDEALHNGLDFTGGFFPGNTTNLAQSITRLVEKDEMSGRPGAKKSLILLSGSLPSAGDV
ncbi:MAG: VWA domain-containing protein, partial [Coriobacteriales bacterium]|nr:VWA domain-containing protein [Coriobacteriales bacterium]